MNTSPLTRRIALCVGGVAIVGMGLAGCTAKQAPAPTEPAQNSVDAKVTKTGNSFAPSVKAPSAPTALPGNVNTGN